MKRMTYKKSGVDIDAAGVFVEKIIPLVKSTQKKSKLKQLSGFGALFDAEFKRYKNPLLVSSTDGVGTKLKIAQSLNKHDSVGIDLVAMNVNDILCLGAKPLFYLDYIACGKLKVKVLTDVVKGITEGCRQAGCALIGGETAEMPGMYKSDEYDLAGFCVGIVDKNRIINGSNIKAGNKIIGIASNGLHSNGFSLVRKVFSKKEIKKYSKELLKPTRIYVKEILSLLRASSIGSINSPSLESSRAKSRGEHRVSINGIAHITGGAFYDKAAKIVPSGLCLNINKRSWPVPAIFKLIQKKAKLDDKQMYRTFNMGIGLMLVVEKKSAELVISKLAKSGLKSWLIGKVIKSKNKINIGGVK